jgi:hypothetical protein
MNWLSSRSIWTSLTILLFLVVAITGVLMFFKVAPGGLKPIHEWVSVAFVLSSILHVICNWAKFKSYYEYKSVICFTVLIILAIPLFYFGGNSPRHFSPRHIFSQLETSELHVVGQLFGLNDAAISEALNKSKISFKDLHQTLREVSRTNNKHPIEVIETLASISKSSD